MGKKEEKTNVMRVLDQKKISYNHYSYEPDATLTGEEIAEILSEDVDKVFKTLLATNGKNVYYVFMVPANRELNLKKAAKAVGEKSIEMAKAKDLLSLTGYVHGGCSPIGMKKQYKTTIHESARDFDTIIYSGGRVGFQVETTPSDLEKVVALNYVDICD